MHTELSNPEYNRLVWRPDAFGSICFLVCAVATLRTDRTRRAMPPRRGWQGAGAMPADRAPRPGAINHPL
jgi:hypothetical protein